jgi:hypothetical protein
VRQRTVLIGRYALVSPLGRGGMGQVWEGRDERLGRRVAVKLLVGDVLAGGTAPDDLVRRFTREAAVMASLAHPGVPAIYDAGEYDGGLYLVMELIDGYTIGDLIAEQGPLPVPWAAAIGAQAAAVLAVAHERAIVHRDIKPQNVMLTADGTVKVLDFGVAGILDQRMTSTGVTVGTPAYMAPEQMYGHPAAPRTDLYALGCLLYEMLAGQPVFTAASPAELVRKHLEQAPAPLPRDDVHPRLTELVWRLLEKDPARRPEHARQVYDWLLPGVTPPGPLGDIDLARGAQGGMELYAQLLVRLHGAGSPEAGPAGAGSRGAGTDAFRPPPPQPTAGWPGAQAGPRAAAQRGAGWTFTHSLWVLPTLLFGMGAWMSFGYIAARHHRPSWLAAGVVYLALAVAAVVLLISSPDAGNGPEPVQATAGVVLVFVTWSAGFIHALWVNFTVRLPLLAAERG